jgi:hypothetical protein
LNSNNHTYNPTTHSPFFHISTTKPTLFKIRSTQHPNSVVMNSASGNAPASGNKDYVDKGLEGAEKKFGGSAGQNTEKLSGVNEKIVCALWCV